MSDLEESQQKRDNERKEMMKMGISSDEAIKAEYATAITKVVNENPDSLDFGTPAKGGAVKVYGNFNEPEAFKKKIDNAIEIRNYTNTKI